ncbi:MAG TPA: hypothetical protein VF288_14690, partial [Mycobacteriales bacterium]
MADLLAGAEWAAVRTPPGAAATPAALDGLPRLPARMPGTAADVLRSSGLPLGDLDEEDWWWEVALPATDDGVLHVGGLATIGEVWLDDTCVHRGDSMFLAAEVPLGAVAAGARLRIACRALGPRLRARHPRPAWRTRLVRTQNLRFFRTALFGRLAADDTTPAPVGPWRGVSLWSGVQPRLLLAPRVNGTSGTV